MKILRASETFSARPAGHKTTVLLRPGDSALGPRTQGPAPCEQCPDGPGAGTHGIGEISRTPYCWEELVPSGRSQSRNGGNGC